MTGTDNTDERCGCYHSDCRACHGERAIACRECGARVSADCHCATEAACCEDCGRTECDCDDSEGAYTGFGQVSKACAKWRGVAFCDCVGCRERAGF